jgi:O-acetyl-ADP-ribose deacetylase (regulator of RNase III)
VAATLEAAQGDITREAVDAIVNAANSGLARGGGVCGAIFSAAGPELDAACTELGGCPTGDAKATPGFRLPARWIIHAVGPVWHGGGHGEDELLASAYRESLELASDLRSVAFPAISTGVYAFPKERATRIAIREVKRFLAAGGHSLEKVVFCCFSAADEAIYRKVLGEE